MHLNNLYTKAAHMNRINDTDKLKDLLKMVPTG